MSIIIRSIGTSGRDYSTITDWEADLNDTGIYGTGNDAVGVCYNDSIFRDSVDFSVGSVTKLNSVTLTVDENSRHTGKPFTGARVEYTGADVNILRTEFGSKVYPSSGFKIEWLELHMLPSGGIVHVTPTVVYGSSKVPTSKHIYNNLIISSPKESSLQSVGIWADTGMDVHNCIVYDIFGKGTILPTKAIDCRGYNVVTNCTVYNVSDSRTNAFGITNHKNFNRPFEVSNCAVFDVSSSGTVAKCIDDNNWDFITFQNNMTSDDTGSGITGVLAVDQFVSLSGGNIDLHLKSISTGIGSGLDLGAGVKAIDIDGFDRDSVDIVWDIGAHQFSMVSGEYFRGMWFHVLV